MVTLWRTSLMLATKLAAVPGPAACHVCRHASRGAYGWTSQRSSDSHPKKKQQEDMFEDDHGVDEVEAGLDSIISEENRRRKAIKFHMIKKKMNSPGAPERKLTWEAMEQIRYLKRESPDEWTLQRLAEGFSVSTDVISRILRSKFTPSAARKLKQDAKVSLSVGQQSLREGKSEQSRFQRMAGPAAALSAGHTTALTTLNTGVPGLMPSAGNTTPSQLSMVRKVTSALPESAAEMEMVRGVVQEMEEEEEEDEEWDGVILTEEEVEHFSQTLEKKPSPVVQKGTEFFDSEGNFLYRI